MTGWWSQPASRSDRTTALWTMARDALEALASGVRIAQCAAEDCRLVFVDDSRAGVTQARYQRPLVPSERFLMTNAVHDPPAPTGTHHGAGLSASLSASLSAAGSVAEHLVNGTRP